MGEIVIADNGSRDGSQTIARERGARVVDIPARGYGAALLGEAIEGGGRLVLGVGVHVGQQAAGLHVGNQHQPDPGTQEQGQQTEVDGGRFLHGTEAAATGAAEGVAGAARWKKRGASAAARCTGARFQT